MIRCIAIDDEPLALGQIVAYIDKTPFLTCIERFDNAIPVLEYLQNNEVDLIFADINLPDLNGMDFVKSLTNPPRVIFTTAYDQYAVEGFKVNAVDYLLKPISYIEFLKAANKAKDWITPQSASINKQEMTDFITIKSEHKLIRLQLSDIKYIEGMREYVRFHFENQKPVMSLMSMKKLEEILPSDDFLRVHRSYIVNLTKITTIEKQRILFDNNIIIPVGEQYKSKFQEFIQRHFLV